MTYDTWQPHPDLAPYIDAYWAARNEEEASCTGTLLPDACVDIIFNLGADMLVDDGKTLMQNGRSYLVGTMTRYKRITWPQGSRLVGVRFKPSAFLRFFRFASLHEVADQTIEFDQKLLPRILEQDGDPTSCLDRFLGSSFRRPTNSLEPMLDSIRRSKGQLRVATLAKTHFVTVRRLERWFREDLGITPKQYIRFIRYQSALESIRHNRSGRSLFDIAFAHGYYDHAHLSNEIKRFSGSMPSIF